MTREGPPGASHWIRLRPRLSYIPAMPPRRTKDTLAKLAKRMKRRWRVVLLRAKGEILGTVEAPNVAAVKAAAAVQFEPDDIRAVGSLCRSWGSSKPCRP
jgi:hypothetical protein